MPNPTSGSRAGALARSVLDRLAAWDRRSLEARRSPRTRRLVLLAAVVLFAVVSVASYRSLPDLDGANWWLVAVLVLGAPSVTVAVNAAEYRTIAAALGHRVGALEAARLTVLASAANLLPLPGGVVVRTRALRRQGSTYGRALRSNAVAGVTWVAVGALVGAALVAVRGDALPAAALAAGGVAGLAAAGWLLSDAAGGAGRWLGRFVAVEGAMVAVNALRLWLAFELLGLPVEPAQAVALTGSVIVAAAIGIFPGGLGLREVLAGAIGAAVDLPAAHAVAATAADRVCSQVGLALIAGALVLSGAATPEDTGPVPVPEVAEP